MKKERVIKLPRLIEGLNNSQRIRIIVDGVGIHTTVRGAFDLVFYRHREAVVRALHSLAVSRSIKEKTTGLATRFDIRQDDGFHSVDVQVDLI